MYRTINWPRRPLPFIIIEPPNNTNIGFVTAKNQSPEQPGILEPIQNCQPRHSIGWLACVPVRIGSLTLSQLLCQILCMSLLTYFEVPIPAAQLSGMGRRQVGETGGAEAVWQNLETQNPISQPIRIECGESVRENKKHVKKYSSSIHIPNSEKLSIQNFEPAPPCHAN